MAYVTEKDLKLFNSIQEELMTNFRQQEIDYVTVSNLQSEDLDDDIYGEITKEDIVFSDPITIHAYVQQNAPEIQTNELGIKYKNSIVVFVHKTYLEDMALQIIEGQFFRWNENIYQILQQTGQQVQIWGNPDWQVYRRFICVLK